MTRRSISWVLVDDRALDFLSGRTITGPSLGAQRRTFVAMQDEVNNTRNAKSPEMLRGVMSRHHGSGLNAEQWDDFLLVYKGNVDSALSGYIAWADKEIAKIMLSGPGDNSWSKALMPSS